LVLGYHSGFLPAAISSRRPVVFESGESGATRVHAPGADGYTIGCDRSCSEPVDEQALTFQNGRNAVGRP